MSLRTKDVFRRLPALLHRRAALRHDYRLGSVLIDPAPDCLLVI